MSGSQLEEIFQGMEKNDILHASRLLTGQFLACALKYIFESLIDDRAGYVPNADALKAIAKVVKRLKSRDPDLVYLLDRWLSPHRTNSCS